MSQLGLALDTGSRHISLLLLLSFVVYAALGVLLQSNLIWIFALASLGSWMGTETGYMSGWGAYYLGMNYPLRFVLFGTLLTGSALAWEKPCKLLVPDKGCLPPSLQAGDLPSNLKIVEYGTHEQLLHKLKDPVTSAEVLLP